jgi:hypothetical protein
LGHDQAPKRAAFQRIDGLERHERESMVSGQ